MKKRQAFTDIEYSCRKKKTKREAFLEIMDEIIPWDEWVGILAFSSTQNAEKARDPEMHQTKKGSEWRFGMKCRIGADAGSGLVHTMKATTAPAVCPRFPSASWIGSA